MGSERPQEFYIDAKWDRCVDLALRRVVYGSLFGGAAALILFSKRTQSSKLILLLWLTTSAGHYSKYGMWQEYFVHSMNWTPCEA